MGQVLSPEQDYLVRLREEKQQLDDRILKLHAFFSSRKFAEVPCDEQLRLEEQFTHMHRYADVLRRRLEAVGWA